MPYDDLLTLRDAAKACRRTRKELQTLVERGALPAVRREGHWLVSRTDLGMLFPQPVTALRSPAAATSMSKRAKRVPEAVEGSPPSAEAALKATNPAVESVESTKPVLTPAEPALSSAEGALDSEEPAAEGVTGSRGQSKRHQTVELLLEMLRERDVQIAALHEERARLSGHIGFLQGVLVERETRLHLLEAVPAAPALAVVEAPAASAAEVSGPRLAAAAAAAPADGATEAAHGSLHSASMEAPAYAGEPAGGAPHADLPAEPLNGTSPVLHPTPARVGEAIHEIPQADSAAAAPSAALPAEATASAGSADEASAPAHEAAGAGQDSSGDSSPAADQSAAPPAPAIAGTQAAEQTAPSGRPGLGIRWLGSVSGALRKIGRR